MSNSNQLVTKSETQNILLVLTTESGTIRSQGYYWSAEEAIAAAQNAGGSYNVRNLETGEMIASKR